jgi:hypothetical protein
VDSIRCPGCGRELRLQAALCPACGFSFLGSQVEPQDEPLRPWDAGPIDQSAAKMGEGRKLAVLAAALGAGALAAPLVVFSLLSFTRPSWFTFFVSWGVGPLSIVGSVMAVVLGRRAQERFVDLGSLSAAAFVGVALGWVGIGLAVLGLVSSLFGIWSGPLNQLTNVFRTS